MLDRNILKEDSFYLMDSEVSGHHGRQEAERGDTRTRYSPKGHVPSDLILPARLQLLRFPEPPKIVPPAGDQALHI
jgi:hypothetical protein